MAKHKKKRKRLHLRRGFILLIVLLLLFGGLPATIATRSGDGCFRKIRMPTVKRCSPKLPTAAICRRTRRCSPPAATF